jgi:hypothetical protein
MSSCSRSDVVVRVFKDGRRDEVDLAVWKVDDCRQSSIRIIKSMMSLDTKERERAFL